MTFILKDTIFKFFGNNEARKDAYRSTFSTGALKGKGIQQRFQEVCADEYDVYLQPTLDEFPKDILSIFDIDSSLIAYYESELGLGFMSDAPESIRRKAVMFQTALIGAKGTTKGFKAFFNLIGITDYSIDERQTSFLFDSSTTFDSSIRRLDSKCSCPTYTISINTSVLDNDQRLLTSKLLPSIIEYMSPCSAKLDIALYYDVLLSSSKSGTLSLDFTGTAIAVIDWGDGTVEDFDTSLGTATHDYLSEDSRDILITFDDVDNVSNLSATAERVSYLFLRDTILNNNTDFTINIQSNKVGVDEINRIISDLFTYSDASQSNSIVVDLRGSDIKSVDANIRSAQSELLSDHDIELRIGGAFNRDFSLDFEQQ